MQSYKAVDLYLYIIRSLRLTDKNLDNTFILFFNFVRFKNQLPYLIITKIYKICISFTSNKLLLIG